MAVVVPIVSEAILERLERRLHADSAAPWEGAAAGLSTAEIDALVGPLPSPLSTELQLWWRHRTWGQGDKLPSAHQFLSLADAVREYGERREEAQTDLDRGRPGVTADHWWDPSRLPVFALFGSILVVAELEKTGERGETPLRRVDWQGFGGEYFATVVAPSLGAYLTSWLDELDTGACAYDRRLRTWLPAAARERPVGRNREKDSLEQAGTGASCNRSRLCRSAAVPV